MVSGASTTLVLGRWQEDNQRYTAAAAHFGATYFKMDNSVYFSLNPNQRWQVNEAFLDRQIAQGKEVILSHDPTTARGTFRQEVRYLELAGCEFRQDGWFWRGTLRDGPR